MTAISALRGTLADRRTARADRRRLERDLASFSTPEQRRELEAILRRHTPAETREVRRILDAQDSERAVRSMSHGRHLAA